MNGNMMTPPIFFLRKIFLRFKKPYRHGREGYYLSFLKRARKIAKLRTKPLTRLKDFFMI